VGASCKRELESCSGKFPVQAVSGVALILAEQAGIRKKAEDFSSVCFQEVMDDTQEAN
jgi:hypothetical protein